MDLALDNLVFDAEWDESKVRRGGNKDNPGQFSKQGGGAKGSSLSIPKFLQRAPIKKHEPKSQFGKINREAINQMTKADLPDLLRARNTGKAKLHQMLSSKYQKLSAENFHQARELLEDFNAEYADKPIDDFYRLAQKVLDYRSIENKVQKWIVPDKGGGDPNDAKSVWSVTKLSENVPKMLNGVELAPWAPPDSAAGWQRDVDENSADFDQPPLPELKIIVDKDGKEIGKQKRGAGVLVREPDGRVWVCHPSHQFAGYDATWPKGTQDKGYGVRATAVKEAYEESGLHVRLTGYAGDVERSINQNARYFWAERIGGTPQDHGWESEKVSLVPVAELKKLLNGKVDKAMVDKLFNKQGEDSLDAFDASGDWDESQVKRGGNPDNPGQFSKQSGSKKTSEKKTDSFSRIMKLPHPLYPQGARPTFRVQRYGDTVKVERKVGKQFKEIKGPVAEEVYQKVLDKVNEEKETKGAAQAAWRTYPVADRSEWHGDADYEQRGGRMETMTPDEFLAQARPLNIDDTARENIDDLKAHIEGGGSLDPLALYQDGREDGRHRAIAAKELGIDRLPVITFRDSEESRVPPGRVGGQALHDKLTKLGKISKHLDYRSREAAASMGAQFLDKGSLSEKQDAYIDKLLARAQKIADKITPPSPEQVKRDADFKAQQEKRKKEIEQNYQKARAAESKDVDEFRAKEGWRGPNNAPHMNTQKVLLEHGFDPQTKENGKETFIGPNNSAVTLHPSQGIGERAGKTEWQLRQGDKFDHGLGFLSLESALHRLKLAKPGARTAKKIVTGEDAALDPMFALDWLDLGFDASSDWDESKVRRGGNPENTGQFSKQSGGAAKGGETTEVKGRLTEAWPAKPKQGSGGVKQAILETLNEQGQQAGWEHAQAYNVPKKMFDTYVGRWKWLAKQHNIYMDLHSKAKQLGIDVGEPEPYFAGSVLKTNKIIKDLKDKIAAVAGGKPGLGGLVWEDKDESLSKTLETDTEKDKVLSAYKTAYKTTKGGEFLKAQSEAYENLKGIGYTAIEAAKMLETSALEADKEKKPSEKESEILAQAQQDSEQTGGKALVKAFDEHHAALMELGYTSVQAFKMLEPYSYVASKTLADLNAFKETYKASKGLKKKALSNTLADQLSDDLGCSIDEAWELLYPKIGEAELEKGQQAKPEPVKEVPTKAAIGATLDVATLKKVGEKEGTTPGGWYQGKDGKKYYVKLQNEPRARNEVLAASLARLAGAETFTYHLLQDGKGSASEARPIGKAGTAAMNATDLEKIKQDFAIHAWLANWDVGGAGPEKPSLNMGLTPDGKPICLDWGGAVLYRGMGALKGAAFTDTAGEWETMRYQVPGKSSNPTAWKLFGKMTPEQLKASAARLKEVSSSDIADLVKSVMPDEAKELVPKLISRRDYILVKSGVGLADVDVKPVAVAKTEPTKPPGPEHGYSTGTAKESALPEPTEKELTKAKKSVPLKLQYVSGEKPLNAAYSKKANALVSEFNKQYEGKTLTDMGALKQKVQDFKNLKAKVDALYAEFDKNYPTYKTPAQLQAEEQKKKFVADNAAMMKEPSYAALVELSADSNYSVNPNSAIYNGKGVVNTMKHYGVSLTPAEGALMRIYIGSGYKELNKAMRAGVMTPGIYAYRVALGKVMGKMPKWKGTAVRGIPNMTKEKFHQIYPEGYVIKSQHFESCGKKHELWGHQAVIRMTGEFADLSMLNTGEGGGEIIALPGSSWHITKSTPGTGRAYGEQVV